MYIISYCLQWKRWYDSRVQSIPSCRANLCVSSKPLTTSWPGSCRSVPHLTQTAKVYWLVTLVKIRARTQGQCEWSSCCVHRAPPPGLRTQKYYQLAFPYSFFPNHTFTYCVCTHIYIHNLITESVLIQNKDNHFLDISPSSKDNLRENQHWLWQKGMVSFALTPCFDFSKCPFSVYTLNDGQGSWRKKTDKLFLFP